MTSDKIINNKQFVDWDNNEDKPVINGCNINDLDELRQGIKDIVFSVCKHEQRTKLKKKFSIPACVVGADNKIITKNSRDKCNDVYNKYIEQYIFKVISQRQEFKKMVKGMKVKNKDIKQFGCYNLEGNIRSQDGYNLALTDVLKKLDKL